MRTNKSMRRSKTVIGVKNMHLRSFGHDNKHYREANVRNITGYRDYAVYSQNKNVQQCLLFFLFFFPSFFLDHYVQHLLKRGKLTFLCYLLVLLPFLGKELTPQYYLSNHQFLYPLKVHHPICHLIFPPDLHSQSPKARRPL